MNSPDDNEKIACDLAILLSCFCFLALIVFSTLPTQAQTVSIPTAATQSAYVLDHPINPNWLVLATHDGRYAISRLQPCDWLHGDINVTLVEPNPTASAELYTADGQGPCHVAVVFGTGNGLGLIDPTPCFMNDAGDCDLDAGEHAWNLPETP